MQLTYIFTTAIAVTLVAASPAELSKRGCYGGGEQFGDKRGAALQYAGQWCSGDGSGGFGTGRTKHACYSHDNGNRVEFWLQRRASTSGNLSKDDCNAYLQSQINGCDRGGEGEADGWYFRLVYGSISCRGDGYANNRIYRADPNRGSC